MNFCNHSWTIFLRKLKIGDLFNILNLLDASFWITLARLFIPRKAGLYEGSARVLRGFGEGSRGFCAGFVENREG